MTELLQWWYLIFVLPFVGALFYILMLISGAVSADHDTDLNAGTMSISIMTADWNTYTTSSRACWPGL